MRKPSVPSRSGTDGSRSCANVNDTAPPPGSKQQSPTLLERRSGSRSHSPSPLNPLVVEEPPLALQSSPIRRVAADSSTSDSDRLLAVDRPLEPVPTNSGGLLWGAASTLSLGMVGSSVLLLPLVFAQAGIVGGALLTGVVSAANLYTSILLVESAAALQPPPPVAAGSGSQPGSGVDLPGGSSSRVWLAAAPVRSYEALAACAGGVRYKLAAQAALLLLLFGSLCGNLVLLMEVTSRLLRDVSVPIAGEWPLVGIVICPILPLSLLPHVRQLENAAAVGNCVLAWLAIAVVAESVHHGLPAFEDIVLWRMGATTPSVCAVMTFSFYIQPQVLPMLAELTEVGPAADGTADEEALAVPLAVPSTASRVTTGALNTSFGAVSCVYGLVGVFGALRYGAKTDDNIMLNLSPGPALDIAVILYLALSYPPTHFALRLTLEEILGGGGAAPDWARHTMLTVGAVGASLLVALALAKQAGIIFAVTGATAAAVVCYVLPVLIYIRLVVDRVPPPAMPTSWMNRAWRWAEPRLLPCAVLVVGTAISSLALLDAIVSHHPGDDAPHLGKAGGRLSKPAVWPRMAVPTESFRGPTRNFQFAPAA